MTALSSRDDLSAGTGTAVLALESPPINSASPSACSRPV
jgi:hypothetical protein